MSPLDSSTSDAAPAKPPRPGMLPGGLVRLVDPAELEGRTLRLPDPNDELEAPLAAANERSIDLAAATLGRLFPNLPLARFAQAADATNLVVGTSAPELIRSLDPESLVERVFQRFHFAPPAQIRFMRDKEPRDLGDIAVQHSGPYPGGHLRLRPAALAAALDDGYTMVLDGVELRDSLSVRLAEMFERLFGCPVNINGYLSSRTHTSFGAHWDDQEVVILQLLGRKDWRVEQPVALSPLKSSHGDETSGTTVWEGRLHPGDAVYIPRGCGHVVNGTDELSYHYTITIPRINGVTLLGGVLEYLGHKQDRKLAGTPLPMFRDSTGTIGLGNADDREVELAIRSAVARFRFSMAPRWTQSLNALIMNSVGNERTAVRSPCPGGWVVAGTSGDEMYLGMANTFVAVPRGIIAETASLTDGASLNAGDSEHGLVAGLTAAGLLERAP